MLSLPLTLLPAAFAGMVGAIAPGTPVVGLLLCAPDSSCIEEGRWLAEHSTEAVAVPTMFFSEALSDPGDTYAADLGHRRSFDEAIAGALVAWQSGDLATASARLDVAERELATLTQPAPQQSLFDLYFVRGGVAGLRQEKTAAVWFARAAAVAWNRSVTLPAAVGPSVAAYQAAQHRILHTKPGTLALASPPEGAVWNVDGVEIGAQAATLTVLAGTHRVIAAVPGRARAWATTVEVNPDQTMAFTAEFPPEMPTEALADLVRAQTAGAWTSAPAFAVLQAWARQRQVSELRLFYVSGAPYSLVTLAVDCR